jgi:hypothetical protein
MLNDSLDGFCWQRQALGAFPWDYIAGEQNREAAETYATQAVAQYAYRYRLSRNGSPT